MKAFGIILALNTLVAGDFINLNFDSPDLSGPLVEEYPGGPFRGQADQIFRGWSVEYGNRIQDTASYSPVGTQLGFPVTLFENVPGSREQSVLGRYSVYFSSSPDPGAGAFLIRQNGEIPSQAKWLDIRSAGYVQAFVNGTKIGEVGAGSSRSVLDVSGFSGKEVELSFLVRPGESAVFDVVGFTSVPEPSTLGLFGFGITVVAWQCYRISKKQKVNV